MTKRDENTDARIEKFLKSKLSKYPELAEEQPRKITVYKRGVLSDEIGLFFNRRIVRGET